MKCPKCNGELVDILYGMPDYESFEKFEKKELYLGGCEMFIGLEQPVYHCFNCKKNFYSDLVNYEDTIEDDCDEIELPSFLANDNVKLSNDAIEQLARGINHKDIKDYCEKHPKEYEEFLKSEFKELDRVKDKNGRIGTILAIYSGTTGIEVEFDDNAPKVETLDMRDIDKL